MEPISATKILATNFPMKHSSMMMLSKFSILSVMTFPGTKETIKYLPYIKGVPIMVCLFYFSEFLRNQYLHIYILKYIPLLCAYNIYPVVGCNNIIYRSFYFGGRMWGLDRVVGRAGYTPGYPFRTDPVPCNLAFSRIRQFAQCKSCILYFYI